MLGHTGYVWWFWFIFVGGIWYLVMWTHTLLLLCLHPQLAAQSALVLPLAKWAVEGAVSVFFSRFSLVLIMAQVYVEILTSGLGRLRLGLKSTYHYSGV